MGKIHFREAEAKDASAIAKLHVSSWKTTYSDILPDDLLNDISVSERTAMWRAVINGSSGSRDTMVFIAEEESGLVGFSACGEQREAALRELGFDAEIGAVYVLRTKQRAGIGRQLMAIMAQALRGQNRRALSLWVLRENTRARSFYEALGGTQVHERVEYLKGFAVSEVAYGWRDLRSIAG